MYLHYWRYSSLPQNLVVMVIKYVPLCAAPGAGEGTSSGGDPTHPPRKKRARVDPTVESVSTYIC